MWYITEQSIINLQTFFWVIILGFGFCRFIIAKTTKTEYFKNDVLNEEQRTEFRHSRNHNLILASFVMIPISITLNLHGIESLSLQKIGLYYFSFSLLCFFIASVLFHTRFKIWLPFTGDILEKMGIVSVTVGFLYLIFGFFKNDPALGAIFSGFFIGIAVIIAIDIYINWVAFHPIDGRKRNPQ